MLQNNPEEFIAKVAKLIVSEKATMIVDHVEYHAIDDEYDTTIFTERMPRNASSAMSVSRGIQDYVFPDSDGEAVFAQALDTADEVEVYAKLPRTFAIPTPVGNYAPDWAIAFKQGMVRHVYFVAETKGTLDTLELRGVEDAKIACAKKLFNEANTSEVRYHEVTNFSDLLALVNANFGHTAITREGLSLLEDLCVAAGHVDALADLPGLRVAGAPPSGTFSRARAIRPQMTASFRAFHHDSGSTEGL